MTSESRVRLAIVSDIHYAGPLESSRRDHVFAAIESSWQRWLVRQYRHWLWLRDPFAHNGLLDDFIRAASDPAPDWVVANGDFSCDSAYVGVSDPAAFESASECLGKLRRAFGPKFKGVIGDHEIGKQMLAAKKGGLRLSSLRCAEQELGLEPVWTLELGRYLLVGIVSTLVAFAIYEAETLLEEHGEWRKLRAMHLDRIREVFAALRSDQRVLLFCHDPSALPFLWREETIRARLSQVERTIIGHLHSNAVYRQSRWMSGMPRITFLGQTPHRHSSALREARLWRPFKPLLCPAIAGIQLLKDGGYYTALVDPTAKAPVEFKFQPLPWGRKCVR